MNNVKNGSWVRWLLVPLVAFLIAFGGWAVGYGALTERSIDVKEKLASLEAQNKLETVAREKLGETVQGNEIVLAEIRTQLVSMEKSLARIERQLEHKK